jgi:hypothetical protein
VELCAGLVIFLVVLAIVALVGHALWLMGATILRSLAPGTAEAEQDGRPPPDVTCVLCGRRFASRRERCPECGLDRHSDEARQLEALATTRSQIVRLARAGDLSVEIRDTVVDTLDRRSDDLVRRLRGVSVRDEEPRPAHRPEREVVEVGEVIETPPDEPELAEVARLLAGQRDVRQLTLEQRQAVLALYRRRPPGVWSRLPADTLLALARLVNLAGLGSRALQLYQLLLANYPQFPDIGEVAVEAAILAERLGAVDRLPALLTHALTLPLTDAQRAAVEDMRARLAGTAALPPAAREEVPVVQPVSAAPVAPVPAPSPEPQPMPVARRAQPVVLEEVPVEVVAPPPPRRGFGEMMAAFMEERNILWGELVGGLLIVGCSIALVLSLREKLEELPYFPFLIVSAVTAALIGAGRYTLSHWKLESTSRGFLVIGTMMVPLSFMVLAGLAAGGIARDTAEMATEVASVLLFGWLVRGAANILVRAPTGPAAPRTDWLVTLAILGSSVGMLLVPHLEARFADTGLLGLVGYVPVACFVLTQAAAWQAVYRRERLEPRQAGGLFAGLGMSAYALGVAFVFILYRTNNVDETLHYLAVPVALAGLPLLLGGTIATARLAGHDDDAAPETIGLPLGVAGVIASILALSGALVMLLALGTAWPHPVRLTAIGAVNAVVLALVAHHFRLWPAYVPAQLCLLVAALTGYHLLAGHVDPAAPALGRQLLEAWFSPGSAAVLVALAGLLAAGGEWQVRAGRDMDGRVLAVGAGVGALASLLLVVGNGWTAPGQAAVVFGLCAAGGWLTNARRRRVWLTVAAAAVFCGFAFFALHWWDPALPASQLVVWTLLASAGGYLLLAEVVGRLPAAATEGVSGAFVEPLRAVALAVSFPAAFAVLPALRWDWLAEAGLATAVVGLVWLVLAWHWRHPLLFAAFQAALAAATLFGSVRALQTQPWFADNAMSLLGDVRSWQAYGVGLAGLALAWTAARFALRKSERLWYLVESSWVGFPPPDRLLLAGLVVLAGLVTFFGVVPGPGQELTPSAVTPTPLNVHGPLAWCWLGLLAAALALTLWQGEAGAAVPGLAALGLCAAAVWAAGFAGELAVASALRWGLGGAFVAGSALVWWRGGLARLASAAGVRWYSGETLAFAVRVLLLVGAALPVLVLTANVAALGFARLHPAGPAPGSLFEELGLVVNNMTPLVLLCVGLAGHGVRERSAGYAFTAGLVALASVVGGYALGIITGGGAIGAVEIVHLGQLATAVPALWLLGWLGVRRQLGRPDLDAGATVGRLQCGVMLEAQEALTWFSYLVWLLPALVLLAVPEWFGGLAAADLAAVKSTAGAWPGWVVVGLAIAAGLARRLDADGVVSSLFAGVAAALLVGVGCCTVALVEPAWDHRALMLAAAGLCAALVLTLVRWAAAPPWPRLVPSADAVLEQVLASAAGGLAVLLALQRAGLFADHYWSAAAVAVVAGAAVAAALLRRMEGWMFAGNVLAVVAASLLVCHDYPGHDDPDWTVRFVQWNLVATGLFGLLWMVLFRRVLPADIVRLEARPWLVTQQVLAAAAQTLLLVVGCVGILLLAYAPPERLPVQAVGGWPGWLALACAAAGALAMLRLLAPALLPHALAGLGVLVGVQAACTAARWDDGEGWLGYHVLAETWLGAAVILLGTTWAADRSRRAAGDAPRTWWTGFVSSWASVPWVAGLAAAVTLLALAAGAEDPLRPYWPGAIVLGASGLMGGVALWKRHGGFQYASGLLLNVVGLVAWLAWTEGTLDRTAPARQFLLIQALCLAVASLVWSVIEMVGQRWLRLAPPAGQGLHFRHLAVWPALALLFLAVAMDTEALLGGRPLAGPDPWTWAVIGCVVAAAAATLWDRAEEGEAGSLPQLYAVGVLAVAALLAQAGLQPQQWSWAASVAVGPYVLAAALLCWLGLRHPDVGARLGMPRREEGWPLGWLVPVQAAGGLLALLGGVRICLVYEDFDTRLGGFLTVVCLVPAAALFAAHWRRLTHSLQWVEGLADERVPRLTTLLLGVVACACLHIAFVGPTDPAPWLHRTVLLMAAVTWCSAAYGMLLPRILPAESGWGPLARRLATPLGGVACGLLFLTLIQEFALYDRQTHHTPLTLAGVIVVAVALLVLVAGALTFALSPASDVLRLSERGRTLYVYAAEVLLVLLFYHLRLNVLEPPRILGSYWVFTIMALAFLGVGLSELFQRRGLRVLADPLQRTSMFLPLLPVLAFLVRPFGAVHAAADAAPDGAQPLANYLSRLPADPRAFAAIWFLFGLLYLVIALSRRSSNLALVAVVLANFGLWVLFGHTDQLTFLVHPQLWLIPVGLIVLAAEHLNRPRLQPAQALALRYAGLLLIYLSSTADMFVAGLGGNVLLPIVLAALSVAGVLLGILLRVRAFLFLGVAFLFLVIFSQIWHAAVDRSQTWVWWASGIVLGVAILTLFALFEKRRNDVLKMIDELKRWR